MNDNDWIKENKKEAIQQAWLDRIAERAKSNPNPRLEMVFDVISFLLIFAVAFVVIAALVKLGIVILS